MTKEQQSVEGLVLRFNSEFSKLNRNRVVEFEINKDNSKLLDRSLIRRSDSVDSDGIFDSRGVRHESDKTLKSYIMNPYDNKIIPIEDVRNYVSIQEPPRVTEISNDLTVHMDSGNIYNIDGHDDVLPDKTIIGNHFTDTDKYVNLKEPLANDPRNRVIKMRFKLVEKN